MDFSLASQSDSELASTLTVTVQLSETSPTPVDVPYTLSGTAIDPDDYTIDASPLTVPADTLTADITITLADDSLDEDDETVILTMGAPTGGVLGTTTVHTATITDDDPTPSVTFSAVSQSQLENIASMTVTVDLSVVSGREVSVPYTLSGSALDPGDYTIDASPLVISAGSTTADITISVNSDALDELDETVVVSMGSPTGATQGATTVHTATITDDDATPSVTFSAGSQSQLENIGSMTVTVNLSAVSGREVSVPYTLSGSALDPDDYTIDASPLVIPAGSASGNILISVVSESLLEATETVILTMGAPSAAVQGAITQHTASIDNDDAEPTVQFQSASQSGPESSGTFDVTVQLSAVSGLAVSVPFSLGGSAVDPDDYTIDASPLMIPAGSTSADIQISVVNESLFEATEDVVLNMGVPTNAQLGATTTHSVDITNDDSAPSVQFSSASQSSGEQAGSFAIDVSLSSVSGLDVTLPYTLGGSAIDPDDYTIDASPLVIPAGQASGQITVNPFNDDLSELTENVIVTLGSPTNASLGATSVHSADLLDNDPLPSVAFSVSSQSALENVGTVLATVQLSAISGQAVSVPFTPGGSSILGVDYTVAASPLVIPAGQASGDIQVMLLDEDTFEGDEEVVLTLGAPSAATLGAPVVYTLTLTNDDPPPTVTFEVDRQVVKESVGLVTVNLQLSPVSGLDAQVLFSVGGTAVSPDDYTIAGGPVAILAGTTSEVIFVIPFDDGLGEHSETVVFTMGLLTGATEGAITEHTLILRDDRPDLQHSAVEDQRTPLTGLQFEPENLDFGLLRVGEASLGQNVLVTNHGPSANTLEQVVIGGPQSAEFSIQFESPTPVALAPGASTTLTISYIPSSKGFSVAELAMGQQLPRWAAPQGQLGGQPDVSLSGESIGPTGGEILTNLGGSEYVDTVLQVWEESYGVSGTVSTVISNDPIQSTLDPELYQSSIRGNNFEVSYDLPDGEYDVTLHMAETELTSVGLRIFDVSIEGVVELDDFDLFFQGGHDKAITRTLRVMVTDGELNINIDTSSGQGLLSAVEVRSIAILDIAPTSLDFGIVAQGGMPTQNLTLDNLGLHTLDLTSFSILLDTPESAGHDLTVTLDATPYTGDHTDITFPVSVSIPPSGSLLVPVEFAPTEHSVSQITLRFEGNFDQQDIGVLALGGSAGDPFLHVVQLVDDVVVDYDDNGTEDVLLDGSDSHTHEVDHFLTAYEWKDGPTTLGTAATISSSFGVGQQIVSLTIWDDNISARELTDSTIFTVYAPDDVPGALVFYYDAGAGSPLALLDSVPVTADFAETRPDLSVGSESGIGGSGLTVNTMVQIKGKFDVDLAETYTFTTVGGADDRLFINAVPYTAPLLLGVGTHDVELRFAVNNVTELPLDLSVTRGGGPPEVLSAQILSHDVLGQLPVINSMPATGTELGGNLITISGFGYFPEASVTVHWGGTDITSVGFSSYTANEIEFTSPPGTGSINVTVETPAGTSNVEQFLYSPVGPIPITFNPRTGTSTIQPVTGEFGPDGKFYVGQLNGEVKAITYDENYTATLEQVFTGVSGLTNSDVLGIAFNPFDPPSPVKIYVAHGELFQNGGGAFAGPSFYTGQVSVLTGPNFDTPVPLITQLPVSNHDHSINGMVFDNNGDLLICVGGNTNAGVIHPNIGDVPESPLSGAILKARTSLGGAFDGALSYVETVGGAPNDDQVFGDIVDLAPGTDVEVHAPGLRNPFDLVLTISGRLYATDNGPNAGFGAASTGPASEDPHPTDPDEILQIEYGVYYGHANRNRGRTDPRQNIYRDTATASIPGEYRRPIAPITSSTNGIVEYRAETFSGALRGQLLVQKWNGSVFHLELTPDGRDDAAPLQALSTFVGALDVTTGPGGALIGMDYSSNQVYTLTPNDVAVSGLTAYEITPWRATANGGQTFVIGGENFGTLGNTTVTIGGNAASLTSVSSKRIVGTIPAEVSPTTDLLDVVVNVNATERTLTGAFRYLFASPGQEPGSWVTSSPMPIALGELACGVIDGKLYVVGEGDDNTMALDIEAGTWDIGLALRTFVGHHHAAEVVDGKLYLIGGLNSGDGKVQIYDPGLDSWSLGADMPWGGGSVQTATINGLIYAAGGIVGSTTVDNCAVYDPVLDSWTNLAPVPTIQGRNHAAAATDGQRLFIFGGRGIGSGAGNFPANGFDDVQIYDPVGDSWETTQDVGSTLAVLPQQRGGMGKAIYYQGEFYVIGGETVSGAGAGPNDTYDRVDVYDPVANTWRLEASMPTHRHGIFPVLHESRIFVVGGGDVVGFSQSNVVEIFTRQ